MKRQQSNKTTTVRKHPRQVPVSRKNPNGITIVDRHIRRLKGTYLDFNDIKKIYKNYPQRKLIYPTPKKLKKYKNSDNYDELIAIWVDYFNKKYNENLDPDVVKALIASESSFDENVSNKIATGLTQITDETLKILQDPNGEVKDFTYYKIRKKDLKDPNVAISMAVRWLIRKKAMAKWRLKREPTNEEIILEYKGLLNSKTDYKNKALENFRENYAFLKER